LLAEKDQQLADTQHALDHKNHIIREQQKYITLVEEYLRLAKIRRFGSNSEKLAFQVDLFDEAERSKRSWTSSPHRRAPGEY